ncbi:MAG: class I SAM-dependent methyltransferase [Firmicutes bacterium]|nr:class I SAM-dependent methyltransferase [Bacillota bacterium]
MADFDWSRIQPAETLELSRTCRFKPEWRPLLLDYLGIRPGVSVLEVGCGPGTFAPYLAEGIASGRVTGLDLDARFIERARQKAQAAGVKNVEYVVGNVEELIALSETRFRWLLENPLYDWEGGVSIAVAGRKPADFPPAL